MHVGRLTALEDRLLAVEREIRLLDRATPRNFWAEVERLSGTRMADGDAPRFRYAARPCDLPRLERELAETEAALSREFGPSGDVDARALVTATLLSERARELVLECRLVSSEGRRVDRALAAERFAVDESLERQAQELAEAWLGARALEADDGSELEADGGSARAVSLAEELGRLAAAAGLAFLIEERPIATLAAVTERSLLVRTGALVSASEARRVFAHEVVAHLLPRLRAGVEGPPYRVGTCEADADEEGRAILCEERAMALGSARKRQLGLRHLAAVSVRSGRPFAEARVELTRRGASEREVVEVLCRVLRGGGLAREIVYLPGYLRVKRALEAEPRLERELERGRVSIAAARRLAHARNAAAETPRG